MLECSLLFCVRQHQKHEFHPFPNHRGSPIAPSAVHQSLPSDFGLFQQLYFRQPLFPPLESPFSASHLASGGGKLGSGSGTATATIFSNNGNAFYPYRASAFPLVAPVPHWWTYQLARAPTLAAVHDSNNAAINSRTRSFAIWRMRA